ncbi:MAG: CBS domain-containing protein [Blastocatellia bacterium]|nr:CBS domain-containing protein [Blastocatellia bacterium]
MKVREIMTQSTIFCRPETNLAEVAKAMLENDCGVLPVTDNSEKVLGVITDRDICIAVGTRSQPASDIRVDEVIQVQSDVQCCSPDDDVKDALDLMQQRQVRRIPVIEGNQKLQGILSINDILLNAQKSAGKGGRGISYEEAINTLKAISAHRPVGQQQQRRIARA